MRYLIILILLVATFTRFHNLGAQSLWNDEGNSYVQATRAFGDIAANAARDIHPPGYYWALKLWRLAVGETEFALRALSALAGVLTVAFAFALGKRLRGDAVGAIGAALVAMNTFAVFYAQEARMYATLALWATAAMWALAGFLRGPNWRAGVLLAAFNALGLWTQYAFPLVMVSQGVVAVIWLVTEPGARFQRFLGYAGANLLAIVLWLPWLPTAWGQVTTWPNTGDGSSLPEALGTVVSWYALGITAPEVAASWVAIALLLILLSVRRVETPARDLLPLIWLVLPTAIFLLGGLFRHSNVKMLLPSQIAFSLAVAAGAAALWRADWRNGPSTPSTDKTTTRSEPVNRAGIDAYRRELLLRVMSRALAVLALVGLFLNIIAGLPPLYADEAYARADYRGIVADIDLGPDDAVILNAPNQEEVFRYYYTAPNPVYPLPRGLGGDDDATRAAVREAIAEHDEIYAVFWGDAERDPQRVVETTLDAESFEVSNRWYGDVRLARYATPAGAFATEAVTGVRFGDHIALERYALSNNPFIPGDVLQVRLTWRADAPLDARYKVFLQLLDADGVLVAQRDAEPGGGLAITTTWEPGEAVIDNHALLIPEDLPSSHYALIVGLYNPDDSGARLLASTNRDTYTLLEVEQ